MTSGPGKPWWRTWRAWILPAVLGLGLVILGISLLPVAPVAPTTATLPDTAAGKLVEKIETIDYPTPQVGWALVAASPYWKLVRTVDAGGKWQDVNPAGDASRGGVVLTVMGPEAAAVVILPFEYIRDSAFAVTTDGGARWSAGVLPNGASSGPDPIFALSAQRIFAVLGSGTVVASTDGGGQWATVNLPALASGTCTPTSIWFTAPASGWVTGSCTGVAALWHSSDAGQSWQSEVLSSTYGSSTPVSVAPPQATPSGGALTTTVATVGSTESLRVFDDSSGSWRAAPALSLPAGRVLVSFANPSDGWVVVAPRATGALALAYYTSSEGNYWSVRTTPISAGQVTGLDLSSSENVVALAQAGRVHLLWTSSNAGVKWTSSELTIVNGPAPVVNGITP
ncbi:MAG: hypothetical protein WA751_02400 [Candidatus Dormiibacterota bacterium]